MRFVDLSVTLQTENAWAPKGLRVLVKNRPHKATLLLLRLMYGIAGRKTRTGLGWADDIIEMSSHGTTHVDAPWHYAPTSEGQPARTIDQLPLEWFYGDGVVLDLRHKRDGETISVRDVKEALQKIGYTIKPGDIVLIQTGSDKYVGTREYYTRGPGMGGEATRWILDQGVRVTGIDAWGWDVPLAVMAKRIRESGRYDLYWEGHLVGLDKEYCHIERLTNLDQLPPYGFKVACFPLKVKAGSAGPARVVAMVGEGN